MASDIHKKLVIGALGCGGLLVVVGGIGLLVSKDEFFKDSVKQETYTPAQAGAAWDSLTKFSIADSIIDPDLPPWTTPGTASVGTLVGVTRGPGFPAFGDTFPTGSTEREDWEETAARVSLHRPGSPADSAFRAPLVVPSAGDRLFQARVLFAAAVAWRREGRVADARLVMDSVLNLAHALEQSGALERQFVGLRIERDAMDVLSRDTALAGGAAAATRAGRRVAPLERFEARVRAVDRLLNVAGSAPEYAGDLGDLVADSSMPLAVRTTAVRAIGLAWTFSPTEPSVGRDPSREKALEKLRGKPLPDSVVATIDRVLHAGDGFASRITVSATYRLERQLLYWR